MEKKKGEESPMSDLTFYSHHDSEFSVQQLKASLQILFLLPGKQGDGVIQKLEHRLARQQTVKVRLKFKLACIEVRV